MLSSVESSISCQMVIKNRSGREKDLDRVNPLINSNHQESAEIFDLHEIWPRASFCVEYAFASHTGENGSSQCHIIALYYSTDIQYYSIIST